MPAKSRRSRRNFPQSRGPSTPTGWAPSAERNIPVMPAESPLRPARGVAAQAETAPAYPYILAELKWIALVTVVIAVLLVVLYLVFR